LGKGVTIGPNAVVRGCVIGDHTHIGAGTMMEGTTIARHSNVDAGVRLRCCVTDREVNMGSFFTQLSVMGRGAVLCPDAGMFDFRLHGDVEIKLYGEKQSSGSRLLGGCLGDRAFMGPGVKLLAGQEVPNDCILIESPRHLVRDVDGKLPERIMRIDAETGRPVRQRKAS
jgi:NDP-sugar pyrophosphorylase family protein